MFDLGWSEMAVILLVALVVIGPKDLPRVAREIGKWTAKARSMARDFQRSLDDMAREAELQDIKAELDKATSGNIGKTIQDFVDPDGELNKALDPNQPAPSLPRPPAPVPEPVSAVAATTAEATAPAATASSTATASPAVVAGAADDKPDRG
ncbi:MAG TPA: Sec-independent protein translocase protein TatB [Geminicoccaceae bacterium]|nr:Sec-independent protein translocase protein TatB [Geminicoccus sp.]HMU52436.1 Sec-independent protein translocase protein TatB [Geminicoccaceae bacterium]